MALIIVIKIPGHPIPYPVMMLASGKTDAPVLCFPFLRAKDMVSDFVLQDSFVLARYSGTTRIIRMVKVCLICRQPHQEHHMRFIYENHTKLTIHYAISDARYGDPAGITACRWMFQQL